MKRKTVFRIKIANGTLSIEFVNFAKLLPFCLHCLHLKALLEHLKVHKKIKINSTNYTAKDKYTYI